MLPPPADASVAGGIDTCLVVLTLFPAFPELERVPAQNQGGKRLVQTNTVSPIEVADVPEWGFDIGVTSIDSQIALRQKLPRFLFSTDVKLLLTQAFLRRCAAAGKKHSSNVARDALL